MLANDAVQDKTTERAPHSPTASLQAKQGQASARANWLATRGGLVLALLSLCLSLTWIWLAPPLRGPDETAHLMAVMEVRTLGRLPVIHYEYRSDPKGNPVPPYSDAAVASYAAKLGLPSGAYDVRYESYQPPLFYVTAGLLSLAVPPDPGPVLYASKLAAALFGALTIYFIWAAVRQLVPGEPLLAHFVGACSALLPVFAYSSASAGNDAALYTAGAASFYVWVRGLREPSFDPYLLKAGAILGLGLLAKLAMVTLVPAFALVVLFRAMQGSESFGAVLRRVALLGAASGVATLAVCGWLLVRNVVEYGELSGSADALRWHASHYGHADLSRASSLLSFVWATMMSFIGLFSWDATTFPNSINVLAYMVIGPLLVLTGAAVVRYVKQHRPLPPEAARYGLILLVASAGTLVGYLQFNMGVNYQPQARLLFVSLLPIMLALLGGLYVTVRRHRIALMVLAIPPALLALLNGVAIAILSHQ